MSVGQNIKRRREQLNMTQTALAKKSGIYKNKSSIATIEKDTEDGISVRSLRILAKCLDCTVEDLLDEDNTKSKKRKNSSKNSKL